MPENQVGAYIRLLSVLWINGSAKADANSLAMIWPSAHQVVDKLKDKFTVHPNNTITNNRMEEIRAERIENRLKRSNSGKKRRSKTMTNQ